MSELAEGIEILWGFTQFFFKQTLKDSAFYLAKKKVYSEKRYDLSHSL